MKVEKRSCSEQLSISVFDIRFFRNASENSCPLFIDRVGTQTDERSGKTMHPTFSCSPVDAHSTVSEIADLAGTNGVAGNEQFWVDRSDKP